MGAPRLALAVLFAGIACLTACQPDPSASGAASAVPTSRSSDAPDGLACEPLELRSPSGQVVDLTGTWRGRSAMFYVRQLGTCLWWMSLSAPSASRPLGAEYADVFSGSIGTDFRVSGTVAIILGRVDLEARPLTLAIEFPQVAGSETVVLKAITANPDADLYGGVTLVRAGPLPSGL